MTNSKYDFHRSSLACDMALENRVSVDHSTTCPLVATCPLLVIIEPLPMPPAQAFCICSDAPLSAVYFMSAQRAEAIRTVAIWFLATTLMIESVSRFSSVFIVSWLFSELLVEELARTTLAFSLAPTSSLLSGFWNVTPAIILSNCAT